MMEMLMKKLGITQKELQEAIQEISESDAGEFMDLALADTKKLMSGKVSKEEVAFKLYRSYLMGFALGKISKED